MDYKIGDNKMNEPMSFTVKMNDIKHEPFIEEKPKEETITLIAGKLNNYETVYYWVNAYNLDLNIDDYAIVRNRNGYDLVKVVGILETTKEHCKSISNNHVENMKHVVSVISADELD